MNKGGTESLADVRVLFVTTSLHCFSLEPTQVAKMALKGLNFLY